MRLPTSIALLAAALLIAPSSGCGDPKLAPATTTSADRFAITSGMPGVPDITVQVVARGDGTAAEPGMVASVHYTGTYPGGEQFDSSRGSKPITFRVGAGEMIPGFDLVVQNMRVGDRWIATLPYQLAYGEQGGGGIPPRATLHFDMELMAVR